MILLDCMKLITRDALRRMRERNDAQARRDIAHDATMAMIAITPLATLPSLDRTIANREQLTTELDAAIQQEPTTRHKECMSEDGRERLLDTQSCRHCGGEGCAECIPIPFDPDELIDLEVDKPEIPDDEPGEYDIEFESE
jgi:hypothetical protein